MNMSTPQTELARTMLAILAIGGMIIASFWIMRPFLPAIIWSAMIVVATWPIMIQLERRFGGRRGWAVTVMTCLLLLILVVPLYLAITTIVDNAGTIANLVKGLPGMTIPPPPEWVERIPVLGSRAAAQWRDVAAEGPQGVIARLTPYLRDIADWFAGQAGNLGLLLVHFILVVIVSACFWAGGEAIAESLRRFVVRLMGARGEGSVKLAGQAIRAVALGVVVTAIVQSALAGIGLAFCGVPYAGLLTAVAFMLCIAQLGPGLVLLPAVVWLYWSGDTVFGTILLVWSIIVGTSDNFLRPILIRRGADLPLWLILAGVIGGLIGFGIIGLFVGPVVLAVTYMAVKNWVDEPGSPSDPGEPEPLDHEGRSANRSAAEVPPA
jgi:predicted PurR-regulated permease PerM